MRASTIVAVPSTVTIQGNTFNGASQLVQLGTDGKLPVLDGSNLTGLASNDASLSFTDITTNNVSTTKHGFAPKAPNDATKYLDGTGNYSVPPSALTDAALAFTDVTTNNVSITKHGFAPKAPNDPTKFLNGAGAWTQPSSIAAGAVSLYSNENIGGTLTSNGTEQLKVMNGRLYAGKNMMPSDQFNEAKFNFGMNWANTTITGQLVNTLCMSADGKYQFAGYTNTTFGVAVSSDYGVTWVTKGGGLSLYTTGICCTPDGSKIVASSSSTTQILVSNDFGNTWTTKSVGGSGTRINAVVMSADGTLIVVADNAGQLSRSADGGTTWAATGTTQTGVMGVVGMSGDGKYVFSMGTTTNYTVHTSSDYGVTWAITFGPLGGSFGTNISVSQDGSRVIIPTNGTIGFLKSTNYGASFSQVTIGAATVGFSSSAMSADGARILLACRVGGSGTIFMSTDSGTTWSGTNIGGAINSLVMSSDGTYVLYNENGNGYYLRRGVNEKLMSEFALNDVTTGNVSTSAHGLAPKLPNDATKFLNGTGTYTQPVISAPVNAGAILYAYTTYGGF